MVRCEEPARLKLHRTDTREGKVEEAKAELEEQSEFRTRMVRSQGRNVEIRLSGRDQVGVD